MKQSPQATIHQRIGALVLVLFFLLPQGSALMQSNQPPVTLTLVWTNPDASVEQSDAMLIPYPGYEKAFWLYVSPDALDDQGANLIITDNLGNYPGGFSPPSGTLFNQLGLIDTGSTPNIPSFEIYGLSGDNAALDSFLLYVSFSAEQPEIVVVPEVTEAPKVTEPPVIEVQPALVIIHYVDENGNEFASDEQFLEAGQHSVRPNNALVPEGYQLSGQGEFGVTVTQSGAKPAEVTFTYQMPVQSATVYIHYVDNNGNEFSAEPRTFEKGKHTVRPDASLVPKNYQLLGPGEYTVNVTQSGANPAEVTFTYQMPVQAVTVFVHYRDEQGKQVASSQTQTLDQGSHDIYAQPADLATGFELAMPDVQTVVVSASGAAPAEVVFVYSAVKPEPTAQSAQIQVKYVDEGGNPVAQEQTQVLQPGVKEISPTPGNLQPGYELVSAPTVLVTVDKNGATPNVVIFTYRQTPSVSIPVDIVVHYVDENGLSVASDTIFTAPEGKNLVNPYPLDLKPGYRLSDEEFKYVTVSGNKAEPSSLSFLYKKETQPETPTPPPAPKVALINILYKLETGTVFHQETAPAKEGETTTVTVDFNRVDSAAYQLLSPETVTVTVDGSGKPTPGEVIFLFRDASVKTAAITLRFQDEAGNEVSPSQTMQIPVGTTSIEAKPTALPAGMLLISESPVAVTLSDSGVTSQTEVVFRYRKQSAETSVPTQSPEPTALPFDITTMDRYGYPDGDTVNFRSSPEVRDSNVISVVSRKDLAHIMGSVKNLQGDEWYLAEINNQEGFLKASIVKLLSFGEAAALFGWTPTPAPSPTPETEQLPDNEPIERWAEVTDPKGVNFRTKASTGATKISQLERGERFWVFSQQTVGKDLWYSIMTNNKKGFLMASYTRLYTQQESAQYQATLASPMPVSVTATPVLPPLTATPSIQTPEPITQTATPEPVTYHGYAITTKQAALRTGASQVDEMVLEMLQANTLVYVWSQTTLGSEGWSSVQVMGDNINGYLQNTSLRYLTDQEAAFYQSQINPQTTQTPSPTPVPQQKAGYALTLGENVPLRAYADTNAQILSLLPGSAVVSVLGQEYNQNSAWHLVQSSTGYGYVRQDQLRMMNMQEERAYLDSLRTPIPVPAATLPPVTLNSPSSYGYVNADKVRLRNGPSKNNQEIKLMSANAFALVYGSSQQTDGLWYHISQSGTDGYVDSKFFTVLSMGELSTYLQSPAYLNSNNAAQPQNGSKLPVKITPVEDFNNTVWQNPNLVIPSYEPFNPLGSPTPPVEDIFTPTPPLPSESPSAAPFTVDEFTVEPPKKDSSFPTGLLITGLIAVLGGGGYYAYHLYRQNEKKAAQRAAQRRAQMAQQAGNPQARPTSQPVSPYAPPRPGTQGTTAYRPGETQAPGQPGAPQGTVNYRPGNAAPQGPVQPGATQGTVNYRPGSAVPQGPIQPGTPPQSTAGYKPLVTPPQGTAGYKPPQPGLPGNAPNSQPPAKANDIPANETRNRRSDKHSNT